jgi:hypothetical protein
MGYQAMKEEPETNVATDQLSLDCVCGRSVELDLLEDYDVPAYVGACVCGRIWQLLEVSGNVQVDEE